MDTLRKNVLIIVSIILTLVLAMFAFAASDPSAPSGFTRGASSTFNDSNFADVQTNAIAGNITALTLTGIAQTRSWQGFYGNVSGRITLDDARNKTFYNWSAAEPRGYVYATLQSAGSITWTRVDCTNLATADGTNFHTRYNISQDAYDNVSNTYYTTLPRNVYIVNNTYGNCPATYIYQNDAPQATNFINYLMEDRSKGAATDRWVFGTVIEDKDLNDWTDEACYNGGECDFQLLVAENGHGTDVAPTAYYIWVDLTS